MTPERWHRITGLFERALLQPSESRPEWLARECDGNEELRRLLLSIITHHEQEQAGSQSSGGCAREVPGAEIPEQLGGGRFQVVERLGTGGFGTVYSAFDKELNLKVALKLLHEAHSKRLSSFKQEFRKSAILEHPNIVQPYELFCDGDRWFFTMQLVDGVSMVDYVRGPKPRAVHRPTGSELERLHATLRQLVSALTALHKSGLIHGDIKPDNVLVSGSGHVYLLDFGLVRDILPGTSLETSMIAGTPFYMAPEQIMQMSVSEAADWYSVGVMLYEALTGMIPFPGGLYQVLFEKCNRDVAFPEGEWGSQALVHLCTTLLSRDPALRPRGAQLLAWTAECTQAPNLNVPDIAPPQIFVGREDELARLSAAFGNLMGGRPLCTHVHGQSGMGKTALVREFLLKVRKSANAVILEGRCYEQESVPFKALDSVVDSLVRCLARLDPQDAAAVLPRGLQFLARVFPVMQQFVPLTAANTRSAYAVEPQEVRNRAISALKELLARLADRKRVVVWIDDLQWGDPDSELVLTEILRQPGAPTLLLVLSYRTEEIAFSPLLQNVRRTANAIGLLDEIEVSPLSEGKARELVLAIQLGLDDADAGAIAAEAAGSPLFIKELAQSRDSNQRRSATLFDAIQCSVRALEPPLRKLVELVAVAGQPLPRAVACRTAGLQDAGAGLAASIRARMLLRTCGPGANGLDTYHDKVREAVLSLLDPEELRCYHGQLARSLLGEADTDPERLLWHFTQAFEFASAYTHALGAAAVASECLAFDRAARLYRMALDLRERVVHQGGSVPATPSEPELRRNLADTIASAGRASEAAQAYLDLSSRVDGEYRADLRRLAADQMLRGGNVDEGVQLLRAALREAGVWIPSGRLQIMASVALMRARVRLRGTRFSEKPVSGQPEQILKQVDRLWTSGATLMTTDPLIASYIRGQHYLAALRLGEPYRVSLALMLEAVQASMPRFARYSRCRDTLALASRIAERLEIPHAKAMARLGAAGVALFWGRMPEAMHAALDAEEILRSECRGVAWELAVVRVLYLGALSLMGRFQEYGSRLAQVLREAEINGDLYARFALPLSSSSYVMFLASGRPEESHRELDEKLRAWGRAEFDLPHFSHWYGKIDTYMYQDRYREAWQLAQDTWPALRRSLILDLQLQSLLARQIRARAAIALFVVQRDERLLGEALRFIRFCRGCRIEVARAWGAAIEAAVACCRGYNVLVPPQLQGAEDDFRSCGFVSYASAACYRRGELIGGVSGARLKERAATELATLGIADPVRYSALLLPGFVQRQS